MISKKSIPAIAISLVMTLGAVFIVSASNDYANLQLGNKTLILSQAHQHDQGKENGKNHKEKKDKHEHGDKKSDGMMKDGHHYAHLIVSHADSLKLNDEQIGKIVRLHLKNKKEHEQLMKKLKESMKTFQKESTKPSASDDRLRQLGKDHADAFHSMVEHHIKERHAIHAILSDEQKNQLKSMKMEHDSDSHGNSHGGHSSH